MAFEEVWTKVQGLPEIAVKLVPGVLKEDTKKKLSRKTPEQINEIVEAAIDVVNRGSVETLDELIK